MPHSYSATEHYRLYESQIRDNLRDLLKERFEVAYGKGPLVFHSIEMIMYVLERGEVHATLAELSDYFSTSVSTTRRIIRRLREIQWLQVDRVCFENGAQSANRYSIDGPRFMLVLQQADTHPTVYSFVVRHLYKQPYSMSNAPDPSEPVTGNEPDPWETVKQALTNEGFSRADEIVDLLKKWSFDPQVICKGIAINKALVVALLAVA